MPIYEYKCEKCAHQFEALQSMSDQPLSHCPSCHASSLNKLISPSNFHLKGTGWYVTDFRDKNKSEPSNSSSPPSTNDKPATTTSDTSSTESTGTGDKNTGTTS